MRVLLDTCVLSEIRHPQGDERVKAFVKGLQAANIFVSEVSFGEIIKGVSLLSEGTKKQELEHWVSLLEQHYAKQLLPLDLECSRIWGEITARAQMQGRTLHSGDGQIASTAIRHGLHIVTRNIKDFKETGALLINPWQDAEKT